MLLSGVILFVMSCGGGGGGGGGGGETADTTGPSIAFTSPSPSGSLTYEADPDALPQSLSLSYSDASGINTSTFVAAFTFRGQTIDISSLFTAGSSSATSSSSTSPLYWTVLTKYDMNTDTPVGTVPVYGVSSASTGVLNLVDVDETNNLLYVAATSRNKLVYINLSTGATVREVALPGKPSIIRACPTQAKIYVAFENSNNIYVYTTAGVSSATISVAGTPLNMALNRTTAMAYVIYNSSTTMSKINCANDTASSITLGNEPRLVTTDGLSTGRVYFSGGLGAARGIYLYDSGTETKLASVTDLPEDLSYDAGTHRIFAADFANNAVAAYNAGTGAFINNTSVGSQPFSLRSVPSSLSKLYVLNKGSDSVSIINTANATAGSAISLNADPVGMAVDGTGKYLYVLINLWDLTSASTGTLQAVIRDKAGNANSTSISMSISPVNTGGPTAP